MILSLSHRFLFIHVYKVAGTSITRALKNCDIRKEIKRFPPRTRSIFLKNEGVSKHLFELPGHAHAQDVREACTGARFDRLFKFGFVRNPWDLQLSLYKFNLKYPHLQNNIRDFSSFERFIWTTPVERFRRGQQKRFLFDKDGSQMVDFIGKFERLSEDFEHVCQQIGRHNTTLEHHNATHHDSWSSYYSRRTFEHVRKCMAADIAAFGYSDDPAYYSIH